jgi:type I restriction enzyme S subunit
MRSKEGTFLRDYFKQRIEKGSSGAITYSVTLNNGLVVRSSIDKRMDTNLKESQHKQVRKGDIAYNMMRMWQGAFGLAMDEGIVSPAYVVLECKKNVDPMYAFYLFKTARFIHMFWAYSYGLTEDRLRLYFKDFQNIPVQKLPPLPEQKKIAEILTCWDKAIEKTEKLIEAKTRLKKGLMERLLTGYGSFHSYLTCESEIPDGWSKHILGELGRTYSGLSGKSKDDFGIGKPYIPYLNVYQNSAINKSFLDFVQIKDDEKQSRVMFGDILFTTSSETADEVGVSSVVLDNFEECYLNSFCFGFRLKNHNSISPRFARYLFRGKLFKKELYRLAQGSTRYNLSKTELLKVPIVIPSIEMQNLISKNLDDLEVEIEILKCICFKFKTQKKSLMQHLLTGKTRVKVSP